MIHLLRVVKVTIVCSSVCMSLCFPFPPAMTADELLSVFVYLIVTSDIPNWSVSYMDPIGISVNTLVGMVTSFTSKGLVYLNVLVKIICKLLYYITHRVI